MDKDYLAQVESGDAKPQLEKAEKDYLRHQKMLKILKKEIELKNKEFEIIDANPKILIPKYAYQEDDAYWELQKGYRDLEQQRQMIDDEDKLYQLTKVITAKKEELERLKGEMK